MEEDSGPPLKKPRIHRDEIEKLSRDDLVQRLMEQDSYIESIQSKNETDTGGDGTPDIEEKLKQQQVEATRRENVLVMRLTTKEQDLQEYLNQIQELKQVKNAGTMQLRAMLLDPAINLMFQRMRREMDSCKEKLEQAQNDLAAWKFTPDSQTGKRLMAKCRMLLQENEELGKVISTGRTAKLEGEIALEKKFVEEMKASQAETDEFLVEMDEDTEGLQSTIYFLQHQLKESKDEIQRLRDENEQLHRHDKPTVEGVVTADDIDASSNLHNNTGRTTSLEAPRPPNGNRTASDDNVVSSSSPDGVTRTELVNQSETVNTTSRQSPTPMESNGNEEHVSMETDHSDQPESSSEAGEQPVTCTKSQHNTAQCNYDNPSVGCRTSQLDTDTNTLTADMEKYPLSERMQNGMLSKQLPVVEAETAN